MTSWFNSPASRRDGASSHGPPSDRGTRPGGDMRPADTPSRRPGYAPRTVPISETAISQADGEA